MPDFGTRIPALINNFSNVDANGLVFHRTPQQVLAIATGGGTASGGFFPNGVNGTITTT